MSSIETQMKNNAILIAGKTRPTIGTKIDGKKVAAIFFIFNGFKLISFIYLISKMHIYAYSNKIRDSRYISLASK